jgi:Fuc2NAc and GlcNAc transferase
VSDSLFLVVLMIATFSASSTLTGLVRRYAVSKRLFDVPNARSMHRTPIPRGGGIAVVVAIVGGTLALSATAWVPSRTAVALLGGVLLLAVIGWVDDHRGVSPYWRLAIQLGAAVWALAWLGGVQHVHVGTHIIRSGPLLNIVAAVGIVWLINLYNFMDGIDGIAGAEAVSVGAVAGALLWWAGDRGLAGASVVTAAASGGFLLWNWSPARIFMGDVGSAVLGYVFATLAVASQNGETLFVWQWVLLLGAFVSDSTVTLVRRALHGDRVYQPHRNHAYQRAVQAGWTHARVSGTVVLINLCLGILMAVAKAYPEARSWAVATAVALVIAMYLWVERQYPMWVSSSPT